MSYLIMKNKKEFNKLNTNFVKAPIQIFKLGLDLNTIAVFFYLASGSEEFNPSIRIISLQCGISTNTARRCVNKLLEMNVISRISYGILGTAAKYQFNNPKIWVGVTNEN